MNTNNNKAQGGGEAELQHMVAKLAAHVRPTCGELWAEAELLLNRTAPPSAPAGAQGESVASYIDRLGERIRRGMTDVRRFGANASFGTYMDDLAAEAIAYAAALAQQPAAVDEAQAQGGGAWPVWVRDEALEVLRNVDAQFRATGQKSARIERLINLIAGLPDTAPPSAPVGVEGFDAWWKSHSIDPEFPETMDDRTFAKAAWDAALAQQPAAVDAAMVERACAQFWPSWKNPILRSEADREKMRAALTAALAAQPQGDKA